MNKFEICGVNSPNVVIANNQLYEGKSEHGRSFGFCQCPFCDKKTKVYWWSFRGSGKKCDFCKDVVHGSYKSYKKFKTPELAEEFIKQKNLLEAAK
jgi:hypothetical protein